MPAGYAGIHSGIVELLDTARHAVARSVNALMTASYWEIGRRIVEAEQQGKRRAGYGEQLMERLSADLTAQFGRGFGVNNLENMRQLFLAYPRSAISQTLSGKLGLVELAQVFTLPWSAYVRLLTVKDDHARQFYEAEALRDGWSVCQLGRQIGSQFYECTALSKNRRRCWSRVPCRSQAMPSQPMMRSKTRSCWSSLTSRMSIRNPTWNKP